MFLLAEKTVHEHSSGPMSVGEPVNSFCPGVTAAGGEARERLGEGDTGGAERGRSEVTVDILAAGKCHMPCYLAPAAAACERPRFDGRRVTMTTPFP